MNTHLRAYRWLLQGIVGILDAFPPSRLDRHEILLRKGGYEPSSEIPSGTIWVHGASLGEIITLRPFLARLARVYGRDRLLGSTTTLDGYKQLLADGYCGHATIMPIELPEVLEPFLDRLRPEVLLISETEIWPLLLATLTRRKIPYGILNGRITEKTVRFLRLARSLFGIGIENLAFVFPQDDLYARRFRAIGVDPTRIEVLGCFKYDIDDPVRDLPALREKYGIPPGRQVICFGSTHPGEEEIILEALEPLWSRLNATVVLAPRHLSRVEEVEQHLRRRHLDYSRLSQHRQPAAHVLLIDALGELRNLYAVSSLAFVGGSMIPRGGHNLMEPAAVGVPILSGPHTANFPSETVALREADALRVVDGREGLSAALEGFLDDPDAFAASGRRAQEVQHRMSGACDRTLRRLQEIGLLSHAG